ncbi:MAG: hypothetical protein FJ397_00810 [Verrucomicrobia bacterium]|nr:hypothetical protein [Verrucomicrobiota bacterium]
MRNARVPLLIVAAFALAAVGAALTPAVQSGIVRYLLRRALDPAVDVGSARIGWNGGVRVRELTWRTSAVRLAVAEAEVRVRPASLLGKGKPEFRTVLLRGCVVEPLAPAATAETWREQFRAGLFVALAPGHIEADGEIRLPAATGVIAFRAAGKGAAADGGRALHGEFTFRPEGPILPVVEGRLRVEVPGGGVEAPVRVEGVATGRGEGWPRELTMAGELTEPQAAGAGAWALRVRAGDREVARFKGTLPAAGADGRVHWWADFRDQDVARFFPDPRWSGNRVVGEGELVWSPGAGLIAVRGKADLELGAAARAHPVLARLGLTGGDAEFEVRAGARVWACESLAVHLRAGGTAPVLQLTSRQPWAVDWNARSFQARRPDADLISLELLDFKLPMLPLDEITVGGGLVRGRLIGRVSGGGLALRTEESLQATGLFAAAGEGWRVGNLALTLQGVLRVAPEGWSAEVDTLRLRGSGGEFAVLEVKGGRLTGERESWKVAGRGRVELAAAAALLAGGRDGVLTAGILELDAGATGGTVTALHAHVRASGLRATAELPDLRLDARVDRESSGRLKFHVPLETGSGPNLSRVLLAGALEPAASGGGRLELEVTGPRLDLPALGRFRPLFADKDSVPGNAPPWAGWSGTLMARIDELVAEAGAPWRQTRARLRFDDAMVQAEELESVLEGGANLRASGSLSHAPDENGSYRLQSAVVLRDWSPAGREGESGWFSGKLDLAGSLRSRGTDLEALWAALEGEVHLVSRGGTLRLFPVNLPPAPAGSGRVAEILAAAGGALESLGVRREPPLSRGRAVAELSSILYPLAFDQLSVVAARDAAGNLSLRHLVVLTPELRLTGGGNLLRRPASGLLDGSLALELQLRARGRPAELLRGLGALDEVPDEWGYAAAGLPLRVRGTLGRPDASDLGVRLAALALERNPVSERAADWFNRIRRAK